MATVRSFKMTHRSKKFNLNQRVFIIYMTGNMAAYCYGRFRGRYRWIKAWVRWDNPSHPIPNIQEFEVDSKSHIAKMCAPNTACTRLETGATNADSESNPAVSSG